MFIKFKTINRRPWWCQLTGEDFRCIGCGDGHCSLFWKQLVQVPMPCFIVSGVKVVENGLGLLEDCSRGPLLVVGIVVC